MSIFFKWLWRGRLPSTPWRTPYETFSWKSDTRDKLMKKIEDTKPLNRLSEGKFNILVIGPRGHGKTSLVNAVNSLSHEEEVGTGNAAADPDNVTRHLRCYDFLGRFGNVRFFDSRGLIKKRESNDCYKKDLKNILEGKIKIGYQFKEENAIAEDDDFYNKNPTLQDRMHGVIIVYDINQVYEIHSRHQEDIHVVMRQMHDMNIPVFVFLTKSDKLCTHVRNNIAKIYHSTEVQEAVENTHKWLGVRKRNIYPIVNFEDDVKFACNEQLPLLVALNQCVSTVRSQLFSTERDNRVANSDETIRKTVCNLRR